MQEVMRRLAMRYDKESATREQAKAKRAAALKVADSDLYFAHKGGFYYCSIRCRPEYCVENIQNMLPPASVRRLE